MTLRALYDSTMASMEELAARMVAMEAQLQMVDIKADAQSATGKAMQADAQAVHRRTQTLGAEAM